MGKKCGEELEKSRQEADGTGLGGFGGTSYLKLKNEWPDLEATGGRLPSRHKAKGQATEFSRKIQVSGRLN